MIPGDLFKHVHLVATETEARSFQVGGAHPTGILSCSYLDPQHNNINTDVKIRIPSSYFARLLLLV